MTYDQDQLALIARADHRACGSCGAHIVWVISAKSRKPMPLDPDLDHGGNIELRRGRNSNTIYAAITGPDPERKMFLSHFATCPQSSEWRKGR